MNYGFPRLFIVELAGRGEQIGTETGSSYGYKGFIPLCRCRRKKERPSLYSAHYAYPIIEKSFESIADITVDEEHAIVLMDLKDGLATAAGVLELGYRGQGVMKSWCGARDSIIDLSKSLARHFTPPVAFIIGSVAYPGELLFMAQDGEVLLDAIEE